MAVPPPFGGQPQPGKTCPKCHLLLQQEVIYCPICGTKQPGSAVFVPTSGQPNVGSPPGHLVTNQRLVIGIGLVALAIFGVWFYTNLRGPQGRTIYISAIDPSTGTPLEDPHQKGSVKLEFRNPDKNEIFLLLSVDSVGSEANTHGYGVWLAPGQKRTLTENLGDRYFTGVRLSEYNPDLDQQSPIHIHGVLPDSSDTPSWVGELDGEDHDILAHSVYLGNHPHQ